ncbi:hypothetical protein [Tunturiibacter gelidiferens]|uniref:hypothetical protein n=1 Tax=Tunturiibacter gelidiferens TaxID=3069689 RepID=UPI003D9AD142
MEGGEEPTELLTHVSTRTGEATIFPGWEFFAPVAGANLTLLDLLSASSPTAPRVFLEEPAMIKNQGERWWNKIEQRHERSGIGNLVRPEDIYLSPGTSTTASTSSPASSSTNSAQSTSSTPTAATSPKSTSPPAPPCASTAPSQR